MPNYFTLTLDTTGPGGVTVNIENGSQYATQQLVNLQIGTSDNPTTGYQMKIWGDVDTAYATEVQASEASSSWVSYGTTYQVKLAATGANQNRTIYLKVRDDVHNESSIASKTITLDTSIPVVTTTEPAIKRFSEKPTKDSISFTFTSNEDFVEYKVCLVASAGDAHTSGTVIPTTAGSINTSGTGTFTAGQQISCTIKGTDFKTANGGAGSKGVKVFVRDQSGQWSA